MSMNLDHVSVTGGVQLRAADAAGDLVCAGERGIVEIGINDLLNSAAGKNLAEGDQIFIFVKLQYDLRGQTLHLGGLNEYPCSDMDMAEVSAFTGLQASGEEASKDATATLIVDKK